MAKPWDVLLTPENCVFLFIDHQPQMAFGVATIDRQLLKNNVTAMAKTAKLFNIPTVVTAIESESFSGYVWPEIMDVLQQQPIERTSMNSWEDTAFVEAVKKTGRKKLVMAALWTEVCLALPAISALNDTYDVIIVVDASGGTSFDAHNAAISRMEQYGAQQTSTIQLLLELQRDWSRTETYAGTTDIIAQHFGAYGFGIDYVNTMLHHESQRTKFPHIIKNS